MVAPKDFGSIKFNLARTKAANAEGYTQRELAREVYEGAKENGKDIQQVRGRRRATEVWNPTTGEWTKVI